jgi:hypothetical protein
MQGGITMSTSTEMNVMELDAAELDAQTAQLLPERSALGFFNWSHVDFWQSSFAGSIGGTLPANFATTIGFVVVSQH